MGGSPTRNRFSRVSSQHEVSPRSPHKQISNIAQRLKLTELAAARGRSFLRRGHRSRTRLLLAKLQLDQDFYRLPKAAVSGAAIYAIYVD
jgi:hypothetical protein